MRPPSPYYQNWTKMPHKKKTTDQYWGLPYGLADKESACNAVHLGLIPELGRSAGEGKGYPLQYSGLENSMGYIFHRVAKSQTWVSDFHFHRAISLINMDAKILNKIPANRIHNILKRSHIMTKWALSQECKDSSIFANQSIGYATLTNWKIKMYDSVNSCRESLWQNSTSIYDKNPPERRHRRNIPQHNKSHIW